MFDSYKMKTYRQCVWMQKWIYAVYAPLWIGQKQLKLIWTPEAPLNLLTHQSCWQILEYLFIIFILFVFVLAVPVSRSGISLTAVVFPQGRFPLTWQRRASRSRVSPSTQRCATEGCSTLSSGSARRRASGRSTPGMGPHLIHNIHPVQ